LLSCILFAYLRHGKAYVDQNPVADCWHVVLQEPKVYLAAHACHFNSSQVRLTWNQFDDPARNR
jgi:hypothetical protein